MICVLLPSSDSIQRRPIVYPGGPSVHIRTGGTSSSRLRTLFDVGSLHRTRFPVPGPRTAGAVRQQIKRWAFHFAETTNRSNPPSEPLVRVRSTGNRSPCNCFEPSTRTLGCVQRGGGYGRAWSKSERPSKWSFITLSSRESSRTTPLASGCVPSR